jgi:hypothetical protein
MFNDLNVIGLGIVFSFPSLWGMFLSFFGVDFAFYGSEP